MSTIDEPTLAKTFPELVRAAAAAYGEDVAIILQGDNIATETASFVELERRSAELAKGLIARGVGKGARVGFIFGNGPSFSVMLAAIARIGAIAVPISTLIKANELVRVLRQSDVAGLIVQRTFLGADYVERLCEALPQLRSGDGPDLRLAQTPYLRWVVSSGEALPTTVHDMGWLSEAAETVSEALLREVEAEVHTTDQMVEIYTSGSMALPKGVKHTQGAVLFRTHYVRSMGEVGRGMDAPAWMPMFWVGGLMMTLMPAWEIGARTVCTEATVTNSLMAMGSVLTDADLSSMDGARTKWALGMSETLGPYSYGDVLRAPGYPLCAPIDHVADRFEVRVAVDGKQVDDGERGEVQVRGYAVTTGLHKVERSAFFEPDGFYRTGDIGQMEGKRINFVGRDGDMIKTAGANVSPGEVELELMQLDDVHSAYVVGLPDPVRGQLVVAAVVPHEGVKLDFGAIQTTLRQRLSGFKVPREYVEISRDEIPMLHSNKVSKRMLAAMLTKRLGRDG